MTVIVCPSRDRISWTVLFKTIRLDKCHLELFFSFDATREPDPKYFRNDSLKVLLGWNGHTIYYDLWAAQKVSAFEDDQESWGGIDTSAQEDESQAPDGVLRKEENGGIRSLCLPALLRKEALGDDTMDE